MVVNQLSFGSVTIDGEDFVKDIVVDNGVVKRRNKEESKKFSTIYGHTPLSAGENIPWDCECLVIATGHSGALPVMKEVFQEAEERGIKLLTMSTPEAVKHINGIRTNLILHLTC